MDKMLSGFMKYFINKVERVVIVKSLSSVINSDIDDAFNINYIEDARSAMYVATGISAELKEPVMVLCNGNNDTRDLYSGLTEAYYRQLPIIVITVGAYFDYTREIKDCVAESIFVSSTEDFDFNFDKFLLSNKPIHIVLDSDLIGKNKVKVDPVLRLLENCMYKGYVFVSQSCDYRGTYRFKIVSNTACIGIDGCLSNVLGASLARKHKKYLGIVTEEEFIRDIDTLGNVNMNKSISFIVYSDKCSDLLISYAESLGISVSLVVTNEISQADIINLIDENNTEIIYIRVGA